MSLASIATDRLDGSGIVVSRARRIIGYFNTVVDYINSTLGGTAGAALIGILDTAGRYVAGNVEAALAEIAGSGRTSNDTVRSARLANIDTVTATSSLPNNQVVVRDIGGNIEPSTGTSTDVVLGVNNSGGAIAPAGSGDIVVSGEATVTCGPKAIAIDARLAAGPGGTVHAFQDANVSLMSSVAGAAAADWNAGVLAPAGETLLVFGNADQAGDRGLVITVWGVNGSDAVTSDAITLDAVDSSVPVVGAVSFKRIAYITSSGALTSNLRVQDAATNDIVTNAMGVTGAGTWGIVLTDDSDDALGSAVEVRAGGACAGHVIVVGTNAAGSPQYEDVTMNGTNWVRTTQAWNTVTALWIGEDNAATASLSIQVPRDLAGQGVGIAKIALAAGGTGSAQVINDPARWVQLFRDLLATSAGAGLVGILDTALNFASTTTEGALAEILSRLADAVAATNGASMVAVRDNGNLYTGATGEACLAEIAGTGRIAGDTVRSARTSGVYHLTATSAIANNLVAQRDSGGNYEVGDGTGVFLGVNNSGVEIGVAAEGDVIREGDLTVTAGAGQNIAYGAKLASSPGGMVVTFVEAAHSLMSAVAGAATDDWTAGVLAPAGETIQVAVDFGVADVDKIITVYGLSPAGAVVSDAITLANPDPTVLVAGVTSFASIWYITASAALGNNLVIKDSVGNDIITAGMVVTGAGPWGAVLTDDSDEAYGHRVQVRAAAAHAGHVVIVGTDAAGAAQYEDVTLNGTNWVTSAEYWNNVTALWIGEDNTATPTLSIQVAADLSRAYVGYADEAIAASATGSAIRV